MEYFWLLIWHKSADHGFCIQDAACFDGCTRRLVFLFGTLRNPVLTRSHPSLEMNVLKVAAFILALSLTAALRADDKARFDLAGPTIDIRVTRGNVPSPIAQVPTLQPGDKI